MAIIFIGRCATCCCCGAGASAGAGAGGAGGGGRSGFHEALGATTVINTKNQSKGGRSIYCSGYYSNQTRLDIFLNREI